MSTKKITPDMDSNLKIFEFQGTPFVVKKKFKVGRFLRDLNERPVDALEQVLAPESFEQFLDTEMDMEVDLPEFLEKLSTALSGVGSKN